MEAEREPLRIAVPWREMVTSVAVKRAVQPLSQSWPIEMSEVEPRAGNMWPVRAARGSVEGRLRATMWVDCMVEASGRVTTRGVGVRRMLEKCAWVEKKWLVQPVSAMIGGEGPRQGNVGLNGAIVALHSK